MQVGKGARLLCFAPSGFFIALGRGADHGRVDQRAFADRGAPCLKIARDRFKQALIEPMRD
jgi:hypothetical protein